MLALALASTLVLTACADQTQPTTAQLENLGLQAVQGRQERALQQLRHWAEQGLPVAQRELALAYQDIKPAAAAALLAKAADGGDGQAAYLLGDASYAGKLGQNKDAAQAAHWFAMAAQHGDDRAALMLSRMTKYGEGMPADLKQSVHWLQEASAHGNAQAMFLLSNAYRDGEGIPRDLAQARAWLEKSAEGDFPVAIQDLALALENGDLGLARDPVRAQHLLKEATDERRLHWNVAQ